MPSRVIGSTRPAASPTRHQRGPASASGPRSSAPSDGIGQEYGSRRAPGARPVSRSHAAARARSASAPAPGVGLRADADGQVRRPRKRPEVAGRVAFHFDDDLVARDAVREIAGGDRELAPRERAARAGAARGCWRRRRRSRARRATGSPRSRSRRDAGSVDGHVPHARADERRAGALGGRQQLAVEVAAARDRQGARRAATRARCARCRVHEARRANRDRRERAVEGLGDQVQRAARQPAAARLLARMRRIDERHPRSAPSQQVRRPRPRRPRADDGDVAHVTSAHLRTSHSPSAARAPST